MEQKIPIWWRSGTKPPEQEEEKLRPNPMDRFFAGIAPGNVQSQPKQAASQPKQPIKRPPIRRVQPKQPPRYNKTFETELKTREARNLLKELASVTKSPTRRKVF